MRALIAYIDSESIQHQHTLKASSDYEADFDLLSSHLKPDEPRYIIYKSESSGADQPGTAYVFILYVPDIAKVRSKMMYASSSNSFQRQLGGTGLFSGGTIYWTDIKEVSSKGWKEHQAHEALEAPLTQEEKSLRDVREKEADQMLGTSATKSHLPSATSFAPSIFSAGGSGSSSVQMNFSDDSISNIQTLAQSGNAGAIGLKIELPGEIVQTVNSNSDSRLSSDFFDPKQAQFTFFKNDQGQTYFFYTCPSGTPIKQRMIHATSVKSVLNKGKDLGLDVVERYEGDDAQELVQDFYKDLENKQQDVVSSRSQQRFNRPKAPGRRSKPLA